MDPKRDLADLANRNSVIRAHMAAQGPIYLAEFSKQQVHLDRSWKRRIYTPDELMKSGDSTPAQAMRRVADEYKNLLSERRMSPAGTGAYEAIRNAFEHGNNERGDLRFLVAERWNDTTVELVVEDSGAGGIRHEMFPFISEVQKKRQAAKGFYEFAGEVNPPDHVGVGTKVMMVGFDEVRYFAGGQLGGLLVHMKKQLPPQEQYRGWQSRKKH